MGISINNVSKKFGDFEALKDVNIEICDGELTALLGPSGSGKTTLLRIIAGLEIADSGVILINGEDASYRHIRERRVGFVFQHYALFRHMTVFDNIAFSLKIRKRKERPSKGEIKERANKLLRLVQLEGLRNRYPSQLSGGQRQRVALARALAMEPKILLLDEPFGALDARVRAELRGWLRDLHDEIHITSIFVTHDQEEALEVADTIIVMNKGGIEQTGTPEEVYNNPKNPFVFNFLGNVNLFHGRINEASTFMAGMDKGASILAAANGEQTIGYVRSQDIDIDRESSYLSGIPATVKDIRTVGPVARVSLIVVGNPDVVEAELTRDKYRALDLKSGEKVFVRPKNVKVFVEDYQI
ncbi:MAG: sulfate/molybdate ABC transporter ATP-binding protein [Desulfatiglans sp.]|jgi:sulfate transport system ATP-binding protein|nr:sulfate/molybdate ABC transporter ATP-binding protein [Desulfatiglans sp.]